MAQPETRLNRPACSLDHIRNRKNWPNSLICGRTWSSHSGLAPGLELGQAELALPVANSTQNKRTADNRSFRNQEVLKVNYLQITRFRLQIFASHSTGSFDTPSLISFITIVISKVRLSYDAPSFNNPYNAPFVWRCLYYDWIFFQSS